MDCTPFGICPTFSPEEMEARGSGTQENRTNTMFITPHRGLSCQHQPSLSLLLTLAPHVWQLPRGSSYSPAPLSVMWTVGRKHYQPTLSEWGRAPSPGDPILYRNALVFLCTRHGSGTHVSSVNDFSRCLLCVSHVTQHSLTDVLLPVVSASVPARVFSPLPRSLENSRTLLV